MSKYINFIKGNWFGLLLIIVCPIFILWNFHDIDSKQYENAKLVTFQVVKTSIRDQQWGICSPAKPLLVSIFNPTDKPIEKVRFYISVLSLPNSEGIQEDLAGYDRHELAGNYPSKKVIRECVAIPEVEHNNPSVLTYGTKLEFVQFKGDKDHVRKFVRGTSNG
jgi:hypothetical protein